MSNTSEKSPASRSPIAEPPEPNPFTPSEFAAWRGMLRVYSTVVRELDRRLQRDHGIGIDSYGVLITLITEPGSQLTIGRLGEAQVTHHSTVRELLFDNLDERHIKTLGDIWEKTIPGSVSSPIWPL